eukprot:191017-Chlamydomonas_euryale.AAC.1
MPGGQQKKNTPSPFLPRAHPPRHSPFRAAGTRARRHARRPEIDTLAVSSTTRSSATTLAFSRSPRARTAPCQAARNRHSRCLFYHTLIRHHTRLFAQLVRAHGAMPGGQK